MGKRRFTKTPISGHWSQRFRRMRVYNPRATFEQAELISKLFEESNKSKKQSGKQNQATESEEKEQTILFTDLPDDILLKIFNYISIPDHYGIQALQSNYLFGGRRIIAIKRLYRLRSVCKRFRDVINEFHQHLPKPSIGLRLQAPVERDRNYGGCVVAYIYGESGKRYFSKCVLISEVPSAIFPGQICTFLIIKGLVITDALMDMLLGLDLSKVEELFWYDIRGSRVTNLIEKMQALLIKMTSLCCAEFYSTDDFFDPTTMFPNSNDYWKERGWEKLDETDMERREVLGKYKRIKKWAVIRQMRSRGRRRRVVV
ncbi:F-box domain protein [Trichostrongylus colubriformis]|uniref:F-box domain protein n=1 Tax=Trichostrongylus colubriformis TaxID=6319 RepID=A0AAN8G4W7_TRICO